MNEEKRIIRKTLIDCVGNNYRLKGDDIGKASVQRMLYAAGNLCESNEAYISFTRSEDIRRNMEQHTLEEYVDIIVEDYINSVLNDRNNANYYKTELEDAVLATYNKYGWNAPREVLATCLKDCIKKR